MLTNHSVNHGEGVSIGMIAAAWISKEKGHISESDYNKVNRILEVYRLPTRIPKLDITKIIEIMRRDKKAEAGQIRFVLPTGIGKNPLLRYVNDRVVLRMLERLT
jgi:3-dehydroquinate synthase